VGAAIDGRGGTDGRLSPTPVLSDRGKGKGSLLFIIAGLEVLSQFHRHISYPSGNS